MNAEKPLGHKSYGSIPHLPGSRTGPADHTITDGQARICTVKARDKHDLIIVQEKLDGSNCSVARVGNDIIALGRAGYTAQSSRFEMHQLFAAWVRGRESLFRELLDDGERVCGEWLLQAHGTLYATIPTDELFRPFDIMRGMLDRQPSVIVGDRASHVGLRPVTTLHIGGPLSVTDALTALESSAYCLPTADGSLREGCVWRVERHDKVELLAKYVRPEKVDGKYLDGDPVWLGAL
jgi:hypothetical protein